MFYTVSLNDNNLNAIDAVNVSSHAEHEYDMAFMREAHAWHKNAKVDMRRLFLNGKMTRFWLTEQGKILREDKIRPAECLIKWHKGERKYVVLHGKMNDIETSVSLADIMAEHFLLEGAPIGAFEISFKNAKKSKNMCALENLIVEKKGIGTVAVKKAVKVLRKGRFYAYYDSVNACAKDIEIPSRKVSEMAKSGEVYKHFVVANC